MATRIILMYFLFAKILIPSFQQNEYKATILQSMKDIEGNNTLTYLFGELINKESASSTSNDANDFETGDQIFSTDESDTQGRSVDIRKLVGSKTLLWPNNTIYYTISSTFSSTARAKIIDGIQHWQSVTCLKFVPVDDMNDEEWTQAGHKNFINIINGRGCASYVGFHKHLNGQSVYLKESSCMKIRTILHEIGHSLGFYHEQNRSDRDKFIEVHLDNVKEMYHGNFNKFPTLNKVMYDYNSVMQYGGTYFSMNELSTMVSKDQNLGFLLGNDEDVTFYDIKTANIAYECDSECSASETPTCENDGFLNQSCTCFCPDVLAGDRCEKISTSLDKIECDSRIITLGDQEFITLTSPNYPATYPNEIKCGWLVKSPPDTNMTISIQLKDIPRNTRTHKCFHSLEVRYNLIGQYGPRLCGNTDHSIHLKTTGNIAMVILHAENDYYGQGFEITFGTGQHTSPCIPNPCPIPGQVCEETIGGHQCRCPSHLQGPDCIVVDTITCNFDVPMGPEELCLFYQNKDDDFDWIRKQGSTKSSATGPDDDKTGGGYYLYIEASYMEKNDRAILTSAKISGGVKCLSFFYHMYGSSTGELLVSVHAGDNAYEWQKTGNQGDKWLEANINLNIDENFIFDIIAVRGQGYTSDIAIDSVRLTNGECDSSKRRINVVDFSVIGDFFRICPPHLLGPSCDHIADVWCDFDDDDDNNGWCIFRNESNSNVYWNRLKGETGSDFTGPLSDVSGKGFYLYVEVTDPAKQGDTASISTPLIQEGSKCVEFFFHMYGDEKSMGLFNITLTDADGTFHSFISSHNYGNDWHLCRISVNSLRMFKVVFSYTVGSGFRADVAIDNFSVAHGTCGQESYIISLNDGGDTIEGLSSIL